MAGISGTRSAQQVRIAAALRTRYRTLTKDPPGTVKVMTNMDDPRRTIHDGRRRAKVPS